MELGGGDGGENRSEDEVVVLDLPPGFRFHPTDEEIITHYLSNKVCNTNFTAIAIGQVDLNKCEPWDLPKRAKMGETEWFFFCQKDRKYPTGMRTNRATESGYWKATGKDKEIYSKGKDRHYHHLIGMKKTLVFYKGRAPKGEKSNWVMHEFRLEGKYSYYNLPKSPKEEWVVCRVVHKKDAGASPTTTRDVTSINSFVEGLLDSPSLPPLMDFNHNLNDKDTDIEQADDFKGTILINPQYMNDDHQLQMQPQTYIFNPTTYYQTATHPNTNFLSYQNAITTLGYVNQEMININSINQNVSVLNNASDRFPLEDQITPLKVEQFSSNQSIVSVSQDTGVSTDVTTTEISSKQELDEANRYQDSDSLWSY